ncbi:hypothetical protein [Fretibacterium sp. OH1220_COT-178]|uniref:hypothetical protein n=1 Tax=Fretibacterium sp. OH1220_COT-178 TaxID=2491047 RepID=UPI000F5F381D|nr:hypothetical protein [Fretibacterium sp. OH1220_COT-178]RRD63852.1 hypothetical protein EII26_09375 [Fretibacterium sp. OH1220_COT-178]
MQNLRWLSGVLVAAFLLPLFSGKAFVREASCAQREPNWVWNVLVVPPQGGWESESGRSIRAALSWHEEEIADSGTGAGGHDLRFVYLPPMDEDSVASAPLSVDRRTAAVMSFASPEVDRGLAGKMASLGVPLLLAGGEDLPPAPDGRPLPFVFALDLFRDYRSKAFAAYAARIMTPQEHLVLMGSRFTVHQEREAKLCQTLLDDAGFMPMPYWVDASVSDTFALVGEEVRSSGQGVLISFMGGMAVKELWRSFMHALTPWRLWHCGRPDDSFLSFRGMIFADQNLLLDQKGGFLDLKRRLWNTRALRVTDAVAAGRADALAQWLVQGLDALPESMEHPDPKALLDRLRRVEFVTFGNQKLELTPEHQRPRYRQVYIVEIRDRSYFLLDSLPVEGPAYVSYY